MPKLVVGKSAGFCMGVRRAVQKAEKIRRTSDPQSHVVTFGPLIHNPQEIQRLRMAGIACLSDEKISPSDIVIVRSHGVTVEQYERLRQSHELHDATCPYVRSSQKVAQRMAAAGYAVILVGDVGHPETESVISFAKQAARPVRQVPPCVVIANAKALPSPQLEKVKKVAILSQTTIDKDQLASVVDVAVRNFQEVRVFNTICQATATRQTEARELAKQADVMIIVGGYNSANTTRLTDICRTLQPCTYQVETANDLDRQWFEGAGQIAVTAGASTPQWLIDEVVLRIKDLCHMIP